jgi:hypothetical protein
LMLCPASLLIMQTCSFAQVIVLCVVHYSLCRAVLYKGASHLVL